MNWNQPTHGGALADNTSQRLHENCMNTNQQSARPTRTLGELFTDHELRTAFTIIDHHKVDRASNLTLNDILIAKVIAPALARINEATGQQNDAGYLAYLLQYAHGLRGQKQGGKQG